ncbi:uncharacterized protein LOC109851368 isoform X2 [Asparagus officinalis]|uniref:uncharacterized protein LOC109851368 isoform X2 n=1 Tax=Asparagus officinalis TaxID=4686 RepID=UPI00098E01C6|nr:uncharacterized protein LOC109851368 isoform X2 [Asparagus officinalis]
MPYAQMRDSFFSSAGFLNTLYWEYRLRDVKEMQLQVIASVAFFQEWLLIHLHSTDHAGVEGQYHWLQQIVIIACFIATVIGIGLPKSFIVSFVRSVSIAFQGVWFIVMAFALWSPGLIPKGCFLKLEDGRDVVRCKDEASLERAKALANLEFSWILALMVVFSVVFYLVLFKCYDVEGHVYVGLGKEDEDLESQRKFGDGVLKC